MRRIKSKLKSYKNPNTNFIFLHYTPRIIKKLYKIDLEEFRIMGTYTSSDVTCVLQSDVIFFPLTPFWQKKLVYHLYIYIFFFFQIKAIHPLPNCPKFQIDVTVNDHFFTVIGNSSGGYFFYLFLSLSLSLSLSEKVTAITPITTQSVWCFLRLGGLRYGLRQKLCFKRNAGKIQNFRIL